MGAVGSHESHASGRGCIGCVATVRTLRVACNWTQGHWLDGHRMDRWAMEVTGKATVVLDDLLDADLRIERTIHPLCRRLG
jgi:hypothetical protein